MIKRGSIFSKVVIVLFFLVILSTFSYSDTQQSCLVLDSSGYHVEPVSNNNCNTNQVYEIDSTTSVSCLKTKDNEYCRSNIELSQCVFDNYLPSQGSIRLLYKENDGVSSSLEGFGDLCEVGCCIKRSNFGNVFLFDSSEVPKIKCMDYSETGFSFNNGIYFFGGTCEESNQGVKSTFVIRDKDTNQIIQNSQIKSSFLDVKDNQAQDSNKDYGYIELVHPPSSHLISITALGYKELSNYFTIEEGKTFQIYLEKSNI
ncbi:hypothetical protein KY334_06815, partial [Candidatus Woesearchaeota archaeon]|nr:hypothetical protein [Candidatus Woesearchaeota archaeon]